MKKENKAQKALRQRNEVLKIIEDCFMQFPSPDEDNHWRVNHNFNILSLQLEPKLFEYFIETEGK